MGRRYTFHHIPVRWVCPLRGVANVRLEFSYHTSGAGISFLLSYSAAIHGTGEFFLAMA